MASFGEISKQAQQFWASRDKRQRTFLLAGAAATVALVTLFAGLLGSPDYKPLYTGLDPADVQTLSAQLDAQGIPHQTSADGKTISVPADKLNVARMQTAAQGSLHSGQMGFELFDKMSWGQTEFDEKVTYQRALQGELEQTIDTLSDVKSARVHLVMPTDSIYEDQQRDAKASVILKLNRGSISPETVQAIARLVAGAVDGLKPQDVCIIDADSDLSLNTSPNGPMDGEGLEASLTKQLINTLEPVVGTGAIRASVNVAYDPSSSEESDEKYDPTVSTLLSDQKSEERDSGMAMGGVPGVASNVPSAKRAKPGKAGAAQAGQQKGGAAAGGAAGGANNASSSQMANAATAGNMQNAGDIATTENARYGVNRVVLRRVVPAGKLERISAAILVDDAVVKTVRGGTVTFTRRPRSPVELNQIQQLAAAVIGFNATRGDTISVQNMSFAGDVDASNLAAPGVAQKVQKAVTEYAALLRPVSLLVLFLLAYLFVLRPIQKQALGPGSVQAPEQPALDRPAGAEQLALGAAKVENATERAGHLKSQTIEMIKQKPINTTRAVQAWLREEAS